MEEINLNDDQRALAIKEFITWCDLSHGKSENQHLKNKFLLASSTGETYLKVLGKNYDN